MAAYLQYRAFGKELAYQLTLELEKGQQMDQPRVGEVPASSSSSSSSSEASQSSRSSVDGGDSDSEKDEDPIQPYEGLPIHTINTHATGRTALGHALDGVLVRDRRTHEGKGGKVFVVEWNGLDDPKNPRNFSHARKLCTTIIVGIIAFLVGVASSIDSAVLSEAAADLHVSEVAESLATGIYLFGFGIGALFSGPFSETFGRSIVYTFTLSVFAIWIMAAALSPNFAAQLCFRFLAGFFGSTPLTAAGGTIADMWDTVEKTYAFPLYSVAGFCGPVLGPVIGSYIGVSELRSWRWAEWLSLIGTGLVMTIVILFQPETYEPILLKWKAAQLRKLTGDDRFRAEIEIVDVSLGVRMKSAVSRPFILAFTEPIIALVGLYMTVLYIVLFTFLDGYTFVFTDVYHFSQGLTNLCWIGICVGMFLVAPLVLPLYHKARRDWATAQTTPEKRFEPETRLWFAMLGGAPAVPISLFWMGWTDRASISPWSPIMASVLFGYGVITIFISSYMYLIDVYKASSASALSFITFMRYTVSGGMVVVGIPFYSNMGVPYTLTILACLSALLVPVPYVFYKYGHIIRGYSKTATHV